MLKTRNTGTINPNDRILATSEKETEHDRLCVPKGIYSLLIPRLSGIDFVLFTLKIIMFYVYDDIANSCEYYMESLENCFIVRFHLTKYK